MNLRGTHVHFACSFHPFALLLDSLLSNLIGVETLLVDRIPVGEVGVIIVVGLNLDLQGHVWILLCEVQCFEQVSCRVVAASLTPSF